MNKVVLVTGGSSDTGRAICKKFAENGYNIAFSYLNNLEKAKLLEKEITSLYNVKILAIKCNISNENEVISMKDQITEKFGKIDVLVNNAAFEIVNNINDKNAKTFNEVLGVNVIGTFLVSKHIANTMLKLKKGKIINISSNNGINKYDPETLEYDASKSAIINMTYNMAKAYSPYINVNAVAPGWIETDKIKELDNSLGNKFISSESEKILLKRFAKPSDIANLVYFLASEEASYINSEVIKIDGGC